MSGPSKKFEALVTRSGTAPAVSCRRRFAAEGQLQTPAVRPARVTGGHGQDPPVTAAANGSTKWPPRIDSGCCSAPCWPVRFRRRPATGGQHVTERPLPVVLRSSRDEGQVSAVEPPLIAGGRRTGYDPLPSLAVPRWPTATQRLYDACPRCSVTHSQVGASGQASHNP